MLKITLLQESKPAALKLEGKLSGPWIAELWRSWMEIQSQEPGQPIPVDLSDVTFVNSKGKKLLRSMFQQGADLQGSSLMMRFLLREIKDRTDEGRENR